MKAGHKLREAVALAVTPELLEEAAGAVDWGDTPRGTLKLERRTLVAQSPSLAEAQRVVDEAAAFIKRRVGV